MFQIGDKIVHPMHGAGVIQSISEERIDGKNMQFYVFQMPVSGLTLKIPTSNTEMIGIRPISDHETLEKVFAKIPDISIDMTPNWNHRYRENMERIKSGNLLEVARVIKGLMWRDQQRGLSNGERKMLHTAKQILISEIVLVADEKYSTVEKKIDSIMMSGVH